MFTRRLLLVVVAVAAFCGPLSAFAADDKRRLAPDAPAQATAVALVKEVHRDDYQKAKTSAQKLALATTLLKEGQESKVAAEKFALLDEARSLGTAAGDVGEALKSIDALAEAFDVDVVALKAKAFSAVTPTTLSEAQSKQLLEAAPAAIDEAIAAENLEAARALADKERNAKSSADFLALADAWWSESERQSGGTSTRARARAGKWYQQALPELTGAAAEKAQQRFDQLGTVEQALLKKWSYGEWKDLLKLVDPKTDVSSGTWTVTKDGVAGRGGFAVFNLPYIPPAEYDLRYTFSRTEGEGGVAATIVLGGHQFKYGMGWWDKNSHAGFEWIDGLAITLGTNNVKHSLVNGQKYQVLLEVRKNGVKAHVDGKFLIECKTDGSNVHYHSTPPPKPNYRLPLGLFTKDPSVFHTFEVRDVTGEGEKLR